MSVSAQRLPYLIRGYWGWCQCKAIPREVVVVAFQSVFRTPHFRDVQPSSNPRIIEACVQDYQSVTEELFKVGPKLPFSPRDFTNHNRRAPCPFKEFDHYVKKASRFGVALKCCHQGRERVEYESSRVYAMKGFENCFKSSTDPGLHRRL